MPALRSPTAFVKVPSGEPVVDALQDRLAESVRSIIATITGTQRLQVFANNAAAVASGLAVGALYRTGADPDVVCVVH